ncbi:hypothetical protein L9F63_023874, partial [Diploptera punctata]
GTLIGNVTAPPISKLINNDVKIHKHIKSIHRSYELSLILTFTRDTIPTNTMSSNNMENRKFTLLIEH